MKTERVVLLTTPDFKALLSREAKKEGVSVAELVRNRVEGRPTDEEAELVRLTAELRTAVAKARASLKSGLSEAQEVLGDLQRARAAKAEALKNASARVRA